MPFATIDVGTNTALLLIADRAPDGRLAVLHQERRFVRLGEGVDASGEVSVAAMGRLRDALLAYRAAAERWDAAPVIVGATSASRDARNQDDLIAFVRRETGLDYAVLSGEEEGHWTFLGALSAFPHLEPDAACAMIDIGGGSTELVVGTPREGPTERRSLEVGAVRLTERCYPTQPAPAGAVHRAQAVVDAALAEAAVPIDGSLPLIGAAGTVMVLALVNAGVSTWAELEGREASLAASAVAAWRQRLAGMTRDEVYALDPRLMAGRADVFPAGVLILDRVLRHYGLPGCRVSPRGLRHGLALRRLAEEGG